MLKLSTYNDAPLLIVKIGKVSKAIIISDKEAKIIEKTKSGVIELERITGNAVRICVLHNHD